MAGNSQLLWLFFALSGRVSRAAYFLAGIFLGLVQAFPLYRFTLVPQDSAPAETWAMIFATTLLISIWCNVALSVKRLHDLGRPGIMALALFVPVVSIVAFIWLCIVPGDAGPNRYGVRTNAPG